LFERNIYEHYQLYCNEKMTIGAFDAFEANGQLFIAVPADYETAQELQQCQAMGDFLRSYGEEGVASIVKTVKGEDTALVDGQSIFLFHCPLAQYTSARTMNPGEKLALFHQKGLYYPQQQSSPYFGQWKYFWEKRLDQLENWYQYILQQPYKTPIDEEFLLTFPYYMGLTENAIQYVVDTQFDAPEWARPTICHRRFTNKAWPQLFNRHHEPLDIKLPTEWIIDHPVRDVAEWMREQCFIEGGEGEIEKFVRAYESVMPISKQAWRLLYARLLFPLHYFEAMEGYYQKRFDDRYIIQVLNNEARNQQFLYRLFEKFPLAYDETLFPMVDWLR